MRRASPAPDPRQELGRRAEALAGERLAATGLVVVARNWRCRHGEIDLVATAPGLVVFCEVTSPTVEAKRFLPISPVSGHLSPCAWR